MTRIIGWLVVVGGNLPRREGRRDVRTGRYRLPVAYISMRQIRGRDREIAPTIAVSSQRSAVRKSRDREIAPTVVNSVSFSVSWSDFLI